MSNQNKDPMAWVQPYLESYDLCPLCRGREWKLVYPLGVLKVYECKACEMLFLNPCLMPEKQKMIFSSPEFLTRVSGFFADYHEDSSWITPKTAAIYKKALGVCERVLPARGKILDIGCGKGTFLVEAKKRGWQAIGLEPNFDAVKLLRESHGIEAYQEDFFEAKIEANSLDVISLWDLIEHTPDPAQWMMRCMHLLKPAGLLVIATPNHHSFLDLAAVFLFRATFGKFDYAIRKLYTVDHTLYLMDQTLRQLYLNCGYEFVQQIKVNTDLTRYTMSNGFRFVAEAMLAVSSLLRRENRIVMIGRKPKG